MKIEVTEKRLSSKDPETGKHYDLAEGDTITVPDALGKRWLSYGWARDVDGKVETGERVVRKGVRVNPKSLRHEMKTTTKGAKNA